VRSCLSELFAFASDQVHELGSSWSLSFTKFGTMVYSMECTCITYYTVITLLLAVPVVLS
jgi:hypothetical protein